VGLFVTARAIFDRPRKRPRLITISGLALVLSMLAGGLFTPTENSSQSVALTGTDGDVKTLGVLLFPDFETLDVFGPLEMFGSIPDKIKLILIGTTPGPITSYQGISVNVDTDVDHAPHTDFLLIPGGHGVRTEVGNTDLLGWIKARSDEAELTMSVCTGAGLLAKAGLLDGRRATTNKQVFDWVTSLGPKTDWVKRARWVDDGDIVTSSGVSAGTDMSMYVIEKLYGPEVLKDVETYTEYTFDPDPSNDKFAVN